MSKKKVKDGVTTKLIGGYQHWQRKCEVCKLPVWTQQIHARTYVCDTCWRLPRRLEGGREVTSQPREDWNGSADNSVMALEEQA